jgi:hypothetical protein
MRLKDWIFWGKSMIYIVKEKMFFKKSLFFCANAQKKHKKRAISESQKWLNEGK